MKVTNVIGMSTVLEGNEFWGSQVQTVVPNQILICTTIAGVTTHTNLALEIAKGSHKMCHRGTAGFS